MTSKVPFQLFGPYADRNRWEVLNGPGDSRVTGYQIIQDEGLVNKWSDKVILITGVSSGIGAETVRVLAQTGATVYGTVRNMDKAREALGDLLDAGRVKLLFMDQTDLSSVRACAREFLEQSAKLNIMINNAAVSFTNSTRYQRHGRITLTIRSTWVMNTPEKRTKDGFELHLGTNHLSHFLLFNLLKDTLIATARSTSGFDSRIINVSSVAHRFSTVPFDNLHFEGNYDGWLAYGASKTANIWMATQIERLYGQEGLHGYSLHPGSFMSPNLQKHSQQEMDGMLQNERGRKYLCSLDQGCATTIFGAVSSTLEGKGGLYLEGASVVIRPAPSDADPLEYGYSTFAFDEANEERLWNLSKGFVGIE